MRSFFSMVTHPFKVKSNPILHSCFIMQKHPNWNRQATISVIYVQPLCVLILRQFFKRLTHKGYKSFPFQWIYRFSNTRTFFHKTWAIASPQIKRRKNKCLFCSEKWAIYSPLSIRFFYNVDYIPAIFVNNTFYF